MPPRALPLQDVRIIAIEQYGAGPFGSLHLADLGADVIKIEDPANGGDVGRSTPPYAIEGDSLFFQAFNRNKRSVALDLTSQAGRAVFEDLVRVSDAVYSNLRGDVPARMRIRYEDLKNVNPAVVCCSLSGFGLTGPRSAQPGYDYLLQGLSGWMSVTGEPDSPPTKTGPSLVDYSGGLVAALALVAGVHAARRDGIGMDCDISLYDTALSMLTYLATWHLNADYAPSRTRDSAHPSLVPFQNFRTKDSFIVVACPKEKFWQRLADALEHPEWCHDPRFASFASRHRHAREVLALIQHEFLQKSTEEWISLLEQKSVPCARINTVEQALSEEQTSSRGLVVATEHPHWQTIRHVATAARVGPGRDEHRRAPSMGEHTADVVHSLIGYDSKRIAELRAAGAFGRGKGQDELRVD